MVLLDMQEYMSGMGNSGSQLGNDINGASGDVYGRTVAISGDGNVVAVGGTGGTANSYRGKYGVYQYISWKYLDHKKWFYLMVKGK